MTVKKSFVGTKTGKSRRLHAAHEDGQTVWKRRKSALRTSRSDRDKSSCEEFAHLPKNRCADKHL